MPSLHDPEPKLWNGYMACPIVFPYSHSVDLKDRLLCEWKIKTNRDEGRPTKPSTTSVLGIFAAILPSPFRPYCSQSIHVCWAVSKPILICIELHNIHQCLHHHQLVCNELQNVTYMCIYIYIVFNRYSCVYIYIYIYIYKYIVCSVYHSLSLSLRTYMYIWVRVWPPPLPNPDGNGSPLP